MGEANSEPCGVKSGTQPHVERRQRVRVFTIKPCVSLICRVNCSNFVFAAAWQVIRLGVRSDDERPMRPRLCILTQYFPPEMGAPQARLSELGERLIASGWDVEALTALPNYPTGKVFDGYDPHQPVVEHYKGIRVVRVPLFCSKGGFFKRLRSYFSFVASAKKHGPKLCEKPNLLFVESPPLFIGYAATYLSKRWNCPFVFNVSDLWPESAIRMGVVRPGILTAMAERLELSLYRRSSGVTGQSSEIIESISKRCPGTKCAVITNGVDANRFGRKHSDDKARAMLGNEPGPIFLYAGLLGLAQGLDQILDLAKLLGPEIPGRFVLIGEGPHRESLQQRITNESIHRVKILGPQPRDHIPSLLASADVAVISLGMSIPGAVPSKIYEAMASALPVLLIADGEARQRIENAQCGVCAKPGDLQEAKRCYLKLVSDVQLRTELGRKGRIAAETVYARDAIAAKLDAFLRTHLKR